MDSVSGNHAYRDLPRHLNIPGYNIGGQIYESASSLVYHAVREQDGQPVILKVLKPDCPQPEEPMCYR